MATREELMAEIQRRGLQVPGQSQQMASPQVKPQSQGIVLDLVNKLDPSGTLSATLGRAAQGYAAGAGIKLPDNQSDLSDTYNKALINESVKHQYENPIDTQLKQARIKAINAGLTVDESGNVSKAPMPQREGLSPMQEMRKAKATDDLYSTFEQNKVKRQMLANAEKSLPNVPTGILGKMKVGYMKNFDPGNPILNDWQNVKMIGTDAQLMNTALTKGAISDQEMKLFSQAAANDDITSVQRLKPVLEKLKQFINAEESAKVGSYRKNYGEDPMQWDGVSGNAENQIITGADGRRYKIIGGDPNDPDVEPIE